MEPGMNLTNLERAVVERFLADSEVKPGGDRIDFDKIQATGREFNVAGFITDLERTEELRVCAPGASMRWGKVGAWLNTARTDTGYVVYVDDGYLTGVEGYTYGEEWPAEIMCFELHDLKP